MIAIIISCIVGYIVFCIASAYANHEKKSPNNNDINHNIDAMDEGI